MFICLVLKGINLLRKFVNVLTGSTHRNHEKHEKGMQTISRKLQEIDHVGYLGVDGRIIFKRKK
jgi:hypothetical protein